MEETFENIEEYHQFILQALQLNDPNKLLRLVIDIGLYDSDYEFSYSVVKRLATHDHYNVRGNALLCFGHLARRFGELPESEVRPLIEKGLLEDRSQQEGSYVAGQSTAAAMDVADYLGWKINGYNE